VLFVARTRYRLPLDESLRRRFDALSAELEWRQLATSANGRAYADDRFTLAPAFPLRRLDGLAFYAALPLRVARELRRTRPDAVVVQGAQEAALVLLARALTRASAKVIFDVHGDWRTATRLYGSPSRRALSPAADALSRLALRHADGVRTVSGYTTGLVRDAGLEPDAVFPAYMDLEAFLAAPRRPPPETPTVLFVGVLERYKAFDVLASAWPEVAAAVPGARLEIVGRGTLDDVARQLVESDPDHVRWTKALETAGVAAALDGATLLVLPSRSEGMGRVIVEAFARGRCVVGSRVGGIPDLVTDEVSGLLVEPGRPEPLAGALVRVLGDRGLAERLGEGARASLQPWLATPQEFAARFRALVDRVLETA
jgi:glycosyltransferase involved in cell wall biosynthesis